MNAHEPRKQTIYGQTKITNMLEIMQGSII
jgi:hypothetical protein